MKKKKKGSSKKSMNFFGKYTTLFLICLTGLFTILYTYRVHWVVWFSLIPLLVASYTEKSYKRLFFFALIISLLSAAVMFDWTLVSIFKWYVYFWVVLIWGFFFAFVALFTKFLRSRMRFSVFAAPCVWIFLMFVLSWSMFDSYIFELSMYQTLMAPLSWIIGARGLTFLFVLFNALGAEFIVRRRKKYFVSLLLLGCVFLFCYVFSFVSEFEGDEVKVALVQGYFPKSWDWRQSHLEDIFNTYRVLSYDHDVDIVVWPEFALPMDLEKRFPRILDELKGLAKSEGKFFVVGSIISEPDLKYHEDVALIISPDGEIFDVYASLSPAFYNEHTFKSVEDVEIFDIGGKKFGVLICYEETNKELANAYSLAGADFILSLSNNQDFGRGIYLSDTYSKLRAAETGKYVARITNTGVTQIVNPYGKVEAMVNPGEQKVLIGSVYLNKDKTLYSLWGNIPVYCFIVLLLLVRKKR